MGIQFDFGGEVLENTMVDTGLVIVMMMAAKASAASVEVPLTDLVDVKVAQSDFKNELDLTKEELYLPDEDIRTNTIDDTLGSDDIIEVVKNFIAQEDLMLQLFLNICFLHPSCYQLEKASTTNYTSSSLSPSSQAIMDNLLARRTETARTILLRIVRDVQEQLKALMFKHIEKGVGERGVSLMATRSIINSIKSIWESLTGDLEDAKSSIQELFYLLPLDTKEQVEAMVEIAEVVQRIPARTEQIMRDSYQHY